MTKAALTEHYLLTCGRVEINREDFKDGKVAVSGNGGGDGDEEEM